MPRTSNEEERCRGVATSHVVVKSISEHVGWLFVQFVEVVQDVTVALLGTRHLAGSGLCAHFATNRARINSVAHDFNAAGIRPLPTCICNANLNSHFPAYCGTTF